MATTTEPRERTAPRGERPRRGTRRRTPRRPLDLVLAWWAAAGAGPRPSLAGRPHPERARREVGPAGRVVVVGTVCFAVWLLLAAPVLRRAAEGSPLGLRRTAALAVLRPLARVGQLAGLDRVDASVSRALGRGPKVAPRIPPAAPVPTLEPDRDGRRDQGEERPGGRGGEPTGRRTGDEEVAPLLPRPTKRNPLRVLVVGDSLAADLGLGLSRVLDDERFVTSVDARQSTGLARPDYFDWHYQVAIDVRAFRAEVVVAMFGANDDQNVVVDGRGLVLGSEEWEAVYRRRIERFIRMVTSSGRPVVWVGMPVMRDPGLSANMRLLNRLYQAEARESPEAVYVDAYELFATRRGGYAPYLPRPGGGRDLVRTGDGVHVTPTGSERLGREVLGALRGLWDARAVEREPAKEGSRRVDGRRETEPTRFRRQVLLEPFAP